MAFEKYATKDNAYGNLLSGIGASTTTINLESGDGARFPSSNFIITLVKYTTTGDDTTPILASEKVLVTNRATDTLTVTRGFGGDTPTSFDAGDNVYLNVVSAIITDIQDEVDTKLPSAGGTRTGMTANRVIYTNNSGNETLVALGSSGTYLGSNGATSAPSFKAPPIDVNGQTNTDTIDRAGDYIAIYDASAGATRKTKIQNIANTASETVAGLVERATDAEAAAATDTTRYITPKQAGDNYTIKSRVITQSIVFDDSSATLTIAHGCGKIPSNIKFDFIGRSNPKGGSWASNAQYTYSDHSSGYNNGGVEVGVMNRDETGYDEWCKRIVTSVDATNINLSRTYAGSFGAETEEVIITLYYN